MGEGELARVLAAVEALTSQVGDISTAVQQQQQGLEEVRRERAREGYVFKKTKEINTNNIR